jgi:nicotinamidase-related amidase
MPTRRKLLLATNLCNGALFHDCPLFSPFAETAIENLAKIAQSQVFEEIYVVNDKHSAGDVEMRYMPPHNISDLGYIVPSRFRDAVEGLRATFLSKKTFNALENIHNKSVILHGGIDDIYLAGGQLSTDVFFTAFAALNLMKTVHVITDCCFDVTREAAKLAMDHMAIINIKLIKSEDVT